MSKSAVKQASDKLQITERFIIARACNQEGIFDPKEIEKYISMYYMKRLLPLFIRQYAKELVA